MKVDTRWFGTIDIDDEKIVLVDILNALTDEAFEKGIIQSDDIVTRDLFDTKLIIDDIKESIPVFYHALEKAITYDTLLGLDF